MNPLIKTSGVSVLLLALAGCADFKLPELPALPSLPTAAPVTDSTDKICSEWKANEVRAEKLYVGKTLSAVSKVKSISEGHDMDTYQKTYDLTFTLKEDSGHGTGYYHDDDIKIIAGALQNISTSRAIEGISRGDKLHISGIIHSVLLGNGCTIFLRRASFSK